MPHNFAVEQRARHSLPRLLTAALSRQGRRQVKTFFFMGRNPKTKSGVSWKVWKIERVGRAVTVLWGPAVVRKRRVLPAGKLQSKTVKLASTRAAADFEGARVRSKLRKGYQRRPRRR